MTTDFNLNHISANELSKLNLMKEIFATGKEKWFTYYFSKRRYYIEFSPVHRKCPQSCDALEGPILTC